MTEWDIEPENNGHDIYAGFLEFIFLEKFAFGHLRGEVV